MPQRKKPQPNANRKFGALAPTHRKFLKTTPNLTQPNGILYKIYNPGLDRPEGTMMSARFLVIF